jgi:hypothetical protein
MMQSLKRNNVLRWYRADEIGKKLDFGAPKNIRKGEKTIDSHWMIQGGGVETKRRKH